MRGQLCPSKWCLGFPDFGDFCLVVVVMNTSQVNCSLFTVCDDQTLHGGDDPRLPHRHAWLSDSFRKLEGKNLGEVPALHKTQRTVHTHTDREMAGPHSDHCFSPPKVSSMHFHAVGMIWCLVLSGAFKIMCYSDEWKSAKCSTCEVSPIVHLPS